MSSRTPHKGDSSAEGENALRDTLRNVQRERDELVAQVRQLTRYQDPSSMWQQMGATTRELRRVEEELVRLQDRDRESRIELSRAVEKAEALRDRVPLLESRVQQQELLIGVLHEELRKGNSSVLELKDANERAALELAEAAKGLASRDRTIAQLRVEAEAKPHADCAVQTDWETAETSEPSASSSMETSAASEALLNELRDVQGRLLESEAKRRALLNQVHDLKGNVRVFIRVRPLLPIDDGAGCVACLPDARTVQLTGSTRGAGQVFTLDSVFAESVDQAAVFREVEDLVQSSLDGYKACIMAYGQTGSGKTHTMTGGTGEARGIVPRAIESLLTRAVSMRAAGWQVSVSLSVVELYNEAFSDMLVRRGEPDADKVKVAIIGDRVVVSGLSAMGIDTTSVGAGSAQFADALRRANASRTVASTDLNEQSSRSHMVFLVDIQCRHLTGTLQGGLRFVDLAGSERLDRTGTLQDSARLRETVNINRSLSCLGDVFGAIGTKQSHVPFRNSKLTTILQDCLSGDGKALMIVSISPSLASGAETLCSLRFASSVNRVELGKAQKHMMVGAPALQPAPTSALACADYGQESTGPAPAQPAKPAVVSLKRPLDAILEEDDHENTAPNSSLGGSTQQRASKYHLRPSSALGPPPSKRPATFLTSSHAMRVSRESLNPGSTHSFLSAPTRTTEMPVVVIDRKRAERRETRRGLGSGSTWR